MPLQVQCRSCGRVLVLNDAFAGGRCRCQHCRTINAVPNSRQSSPTGNLHRPSRPLLVGELPSRNMPVAAEAVHVKPSTGRRSARNRRVVTLGRISGALGALAFLVGLPACYFALSASEAPTVHQTIARVDTDRAAELSHLKGTELAMVTADPLKTYFGLSLDGGIIGYVVDGDTTMSPYIDRVATITNAVNSTFVPGSKRYGIARAYGENGQTLVEVAEPIGDLEGSRLTLSARAASGETNLSSALAVTPDWFADQIFLVMSKPVEASEIQRLASTAEQTGAIVNVIALGEAASQPQLAEVANATRGKFVPVTDAMLSELVARQRAALDDQNRLAAGN